MFWEEVNPLCPQIPTLSGCALLSSKLFTCYIGNIIFLATFGGAAGSGRSDSYSSSSASNTFKAPSRPRGPRKVPTCSICKNQGHTKRSCPNK